MDDRTEAGLKEGAMTVDWLAADDGDHLHPSRCTCAWCQNLRSRGRAPAEPLLTFPDPLNDRRPDTMNNTLILTGEQARELVYDEADPALGLEVEARVQTGTRRWVSMHRLIVRDKNGKLWSSAYEQGLTEYQDTRPFEDPSGAGGAMDAVTFTEVEKVPVTSYEYRPVTA